VQSRYRCENSDEVAFRRRFTVLAVCLVSGLAIGGSTAGQTSGAAETPASDAATTTGDAPSASSAEQPNSPGAAGAAVGGYPIAAARRTAIDARSFQRPLDEERIEKWMEIGSRCTMAEFELFLAPLTEEEMALLEKMQRMQPPIVTRMAFEHLRGVLSKGALLSLREEEELRGNDVRHTTPAVENLLYGAYDCVFASVGPPDGSPRYGDVVIRLEDSVREHGWATPFSGMHFLWSIRHKDAREMQKMLAAGRKLPTTPGSPLELGFDDRLHFSHYVVTEQNWNRALAYQAILVLRNCDASNEGASVRRRFSQMMGKQGHAFWALFIPPRDEDAPAEVQAANVPFGYLEAKIPDRLSLDRVISIEVQPERLDEVRGWSEAGPYLKKIRAKHPGVR